MEGMSAKQACKQRTKKSRGIPGEYRLYLLGNEHFNWYKIGVSSDPRRRMEDLHLPFVISLLYSSPMTFSMKTVWHIEKSLHEHYVSNRLQHEWFHSIDAEDFKAQADLAIQRLR